MLSNSTQPPVFHSPSSFEETSALDYGAETIALAPVPKQIDSIDIFSVVAGMVIGLAISYTCAYIPRLVVPKAVEYTKAFSRRIYATKLRLDERSTIKDPQIVWLLQNHLIIDEVLAWEIVQNTHREVYQSPEASLHGADYARKLFLHEILHAYFGGMQEVWVNNTQPIRLLQLAYSKVKAFLDR